MSHFCTDMSVIYTHRMVKSVEFFKNCSSFNDQALLHTIAWIFFKFSHVAYPASDPLYVPLNEHLTSCVRPLFIFLFSSC
jgi:hypothetical protein